MRLRTFNEVWQIRRVQYTLGDIDLPSPISWDSARVFLAVAIPNLLLLTTLGVPFYPARVLYICPPFVAVMLWRRWNTRAKVPPSVSIPYVVADVFTPSTDTAGRPSFSRQLKMSHLPRVVDPS